MDTAEVAAAYTSQHQGKNKKTNKQTNNSKKYIKKKKTTANQQAFSIVKAKADLLKLDMDQLKPRL
jgi:hypothetical protein